MSLSRVIFRVDSGPGIGLGHLQRSLALAAALHSSGVESLFLEAANSDTENRIRRLGFASETLPKLQPWSVDDARATRDVAVSKGCTTVIVDSHQVGVEYLANLRNAGVYAVVRDDLAAFPFPCQMVFNGNADAEKLCYRSSTGNTVFLLGTDYMVLGQDFWDWRSRNDDRPVENVLVTLGGTDEYNLMPKIFETLDGLPGEFVLTAVIGPFFENVGAVEKAAKQMMRRATVLHSPPSLHDAIMKADLAVSAAGQTLYELARAGCPTVGFSIASNQEGHLQDLADAGFLRLAGDAAKDDVIKSIGETVVSLLEDTHTRSVMASAGRRLVDGQGALRVANQILAGVGSGS